MANNIKIMHGDIFESPAKTIVNPVNTVGVMGAGLARSFKFRYPDMFKQYKKFCQNGSFTIGKLYLYTHTKDYWILNFPTKKDWRTKSRLDYIKIGLLHLKAFYVPNKKNIESIAIPKIGCGLGGLSWENEVKPLIYQLFENTDLKIYLYE